MNWINLLIESNISQAISWALIHSIWQAILIACVLKISLDKFSIENPSHRYNLSFGALLMVFGLMVINFLSFINVYYQSDIANEMIIPFTTSVEYISKQNKLNLWQHICGVIPNLTFVWLIGLMIVTIKYLGGYYLINQLKSNATTIEDKQWVKTLDVVMDKLDVTSNIQILSSKSITSPITIGFFKPIIIFPLAYINQMPIKEVEMILAHELAHIVRWDYVMNIIQIVIESILYFNPGVWMISKIIRQERESACDDLALSTAGDQISYANTLIKINQLNHDLNNLSLGFAAEKSAFHYRIQRLFDQSNQSKSTRFKLGNVWMILIMMSICFAFQFPHEASDTSKKKVIHSLDHNLEEYQEEKSASLEDELLISINGISASFEVIQEDTLNEQGSLDNHSVIQLDTSSENEEKVNIFLQGNPTFGFLNNKAKHPFQSVDSFPSKLGQPFFKKEIHDFDSLLKHSKPYLNTFSFEQNFFDSILQEKEVDIFEKEKAIAKLFEDMSKLELNETKHLRFKEMKDDLTSASIELKKFLDNSESNKFWNGFPFKNHKMFNRELEKNLNAKDLLKKLDGKITPINENDFHRKYPKLSGGLSKAFEKEMTLLGLTESGEVCKIKLNKKQLKINKKKQNEMIHNRFIEIYENYKGLRIGDKSEIIIQIETF